MVVKPALLDLISDSLREFSQTSHVYKNPLRIMYKNYFQSSCVIINRKLFVEFDGINGDGPLNHPLSIY